MKYRCLFITLVASLLCFAAKAQNMVPNGNFEQYTSCPTSPNQTSNCVGWRSYHVGSSDFLACTGSVVAVPSNMYGYQQPASGNAYMGVCNFNASNYKEYIASAITPLTPGYTYEVSVSVALAEVSKWACNDIGIWFYDKGPTATLSSGIGVIPVTPQVSYSSYGTTTDTLNWHRFSGLLYADSAYDNIVIGGFTPYSSMSLVNNPGGSAFFIYYYIDSVVVTRFKQLAFTLNDSSFCVGDSLIVPFVVDSGRFSATNNFSLQLSDIFGGFASPTVIATTTRGSSGVLRGVIPTSVSSSASYRLRIVANNPSDSSLPGKFITISNVLPNKPVASSNSPVCEMDSLKLFASSST